VRTAPNRRGFAIVTWAVLIVMVVVAFELMQDHSSQPSEAIVPGAVGPGRPSQQAPQPPAVMGNLLANGDFEEDLAGWRTVGPAVVERTLGGHASGTAAEVRLAGPSALVGLEFPGAVRSAPLRSEYVASVWVRASVPGLEVSISLVASSRWGREGTKVSARSERPGRWRRVSVRHRVLVHDADVGVVVAASRLPEGQMLEVDDVEVSLLETER